MRRAVGSRPIIHPAHRRATVLATALALALAWVFTTTVGRPHPHMTPEQIAARIQELDALVPVVKRDRFELILERASM